MKILVVARRRDAFKDWCRSKGISPYDPRVTHIGREEQLLGFRGCPMIAVDNFWMDKYLERAVIRWCQTEQIDPYTLPRDISLPPK